MSSILNMGAVSSAHYVVLARTLQAFVIKQPLGVPNQLPDPGTTGRVPGNRGWQWRTQSLSRTPRVSTQAGPPRGALRIRRPESCHGLQPQTCFRNDNHLRLGLRRLRAAIQEDNAISRISNLRLTIMPRELLLGFTMCPAGPYG